MVKVTSGYKTKQRIRYQDKYGLWHTVFVSKNTDKKLGDELYVHKTSDGKTIIWSDNGKCSPYIVRVED